MIRVVILLVFANLAASISVNCKFDSFDKENPPVFLQQIVDGHRILSSSETVVFPHRAVISAYCNAKMDEGDSSTNEIFNLQCQNGTIVDLYDQYMSCEVEGLYRYQWDECPTGLLSYVSGLKLEDTFVIFQAVCYDYENLQTVFVKYVPARRSNILAYQKDLNPVDADFLSSPIEALKMQFLSFEVLGDENITEQISPLIGNLAPVVTFTESSLVPSAIFQPYLTHKTKTNTVIWWKALRDGNWALWQKRLRDLEDVEVYAGVSGVVTAIDDYSEPVELWVQKTHGSVAIPLYIWNYVKSNSSVENDVVIIGINSPFIKDHFSEEASLVCRTDICYMKGYLNDIYRELKYPALGYIICCDPGEVNVNVLHGIPRKLLRDHEPAELGYKPRYRTDIVINTMRTTPKKTVCYDG